MTALATESGAWHEQDIDAVATRLATDPERGLSTTEAGRRLRDVGPNELHERAGRTVGQILWEALSDPDRRHLHGEAVRGRPGRTEPCLVAATACRGDRVVMLDPDGVSGNRQKASAKCLT